jgi:hypothetical protein
MQKEFVNKRSHSIKFYDSFGKLWIIEPGKTHMISVGEAVFDGVDFMTFAVQKLQDYFDNKDIEDKKETNGKCTCSSFDVVNFGCKCGGK